IAGPGRTFRNGKGAIFRRAARCESQEQNRNENPDRLAKAHAGPLSDAMRTDEHARRTPGQPPREEGEGAARSEQGPGKRRTNARGTGERRPGGVGESGYGWGKGC